jgi:hypothetical protein
MGSSTIQVKYSGFWDLSNAVDACFQVLEYPRSEGRPLALFRAAFYRPLMLEIAEAAEECDAEHLTGSSSDSLRTQRALRYNFLAVLVSAYR